MSEESILRLENAMATLAELSAQHDERLAAIERSNQSLAQTVQALGVLTANVQRRVTRLEESYVTVVELLRSHHDGIAEMRAAQANADAKIAVLAESQAHSDRKLDALMDIVRTRFNAQSENS